MRRTFRIRFAACTHTKHIADYQILITIQTVLVWRLHPIRVCVNKKGEYVHGEQENQLEMNKYGIFVHPGDIIGYWNEETYIVRKSNQKF